MKKRGFTLIELLVVSGILLIFGGLLFSLFARAREQARKTTCVSNLKQLALGMLMYARDWDDKFVPGGYSSTLTGKSQDWWTHGGNTPLAGGTFGSYPTALYSHVSNKAFYHCPLDANHDPSSGPVLSYAGNGGCTPDTTDFDCINDYCPDIAGVLSCQGRSLKEIPDPGNTILLACLPMNPANSTAAGYISAMGIDRFSMSPPSPRNYILCWMGVMCGPKTATGGKWDESGDNVPAAQLIHNDGTNWAFCDGRVKWMYMERTIRPRNLWLKDSTSGLQGWDPYGHFEVHF
jgi:prepilin-type N-terminal cleavage/methylation domain-containing protein/prepilin-type processing-associated H-X9-DG protein